MNNAKRAIAQKTRQELVSNYSVGTTSNIMISNIHMLYLSCILMLFISLISLNAQDIESDKEHKKSYIGVGISTIFPGNNNYSENNFGINISYRHRNKLLFFINSINANYNNYKNENDSIRRQNYSVSVGDFFAFKTYNDRILLYGGVDIGLIYKEKLHSCISLNNGFIIKIYKNLNAEMIFKTKYNSSDKFYTEGMLGLSYSF